MDPSLQVPTTPPTSRPRNGSRNFSFGSGKSEGSGGKPKVTESPKDKARRDSIWKGTSKANPNAAINEAQPGAASVLEQSTLQSIREFHHKDAGGNIIADPDRSNPTRPRMERPLETIKNFERAIDGGYDRRHSYMRQDSESWDRNNQFASRRSSHFGGEYMQAPSSRRTKSADALAGYDGNGSNPNGPSPNRFSQAGGYYGNQQGGYVGPGAQNRMRSYPANGRQSESQMSGRNYSSPQHGYHQSHDTVETGYTNGSDSTGPWANSTDPSSENSSIDRVNGAMNKPGTPGMDGYSYNGEQGRGPYQQNGYGPQGQYQQQQQQNGYGQPNQYPQQGGPGPRGSMAAPQVQPPQAARRPIQLGGSGGDDVSTNAMYASQPRAKLPPQPRAEAEKKKGWLKRRFSKNG